jgi:hypothetical protein
LSGVLILYLACTEETGRPRRRWEDNIKMDLQEDSHKQFYGISFMHPYKQSGRFQDVFDTLVLVNFTPLLLLPQERIPEEAGWAPESVWTFWGREKSLILTVQFVAQSQ